MDWASNSTSPRPSRGEGRGEGPLSTNADNFNKLSLDALTGIVWEDDSQIAELCLRRCYDSKRPRIELRILSL